MRQWLVWLWPAPITLVALPLAALIRVSGGQIRSNREALEAAGGCAPKLLRLMNPWMQIEAITLGHLIIARDDCVADRLRSHELIHVRQYQRWGALFPFAYLASSAWAALRGECPYRGNVFEREAFTAGVRDQQRP